MDDSPPIVSQDDKYEQNLEGNGWHDEEIDRDEFVSMLVQEGFPGRGGRFTGLWLVLFDSGFCDIDAKHSEFQDDPRRAPRGIGLLHSSD